MEQIRVWCDMLEHNLVEAISQWRLKVGYQSEHLKLYYSGEELKSILCLEPEMDKKMSLLATRRRRRVSQAKLFLACAE